MATLTVQQVVRAGVTPVFNTAAEAGDAFLNNGKVWLHVKNGAVELNMTLVTPASFSGLGLADLVVTIAADTDAVVGVFPNNLFNDGAGLTQITYDKHENVTLAVLKY